MPTVHVDWLKLVFGPYELCTALDGLEDLFGPYNSADGKGPFNQSWEVESPGVFCAGFDGRARGVLELSGRAASTRDVSDYVRSFSKLRCTRIDLAADFKGDEAAAVDLDEIEAKGRDRAFGRFGAPRSFRSSMNGRSVYFGQRGKNSSGKMIVFYDKRIQQYETREAVIGSLPDWKRVEVRFYRDQAEAVWRRLCDGDALIGELIRGSVECPFPFGPAWAWLRKL